MLTRIRRCLELLSPRERWRWAALVPLALFAAGLEALGAAAVFALIKLVGDPSHGGGLPILSSLADGRDSRTTVLAAVAGVGLFYVFKNVVLTWIAALQGRVIGESVVSVSRRMMQGYLAVPFAAYARRNSAELIRNSTYSAQSAFRDVMESTFAAATESCIAAAIILVLIVKAPLLTLVAGTVLGLLMATLLGVTRRAMARWGRDEQESRGALQQILQETFHGLKEIRLRGRERFYYERFSQRVRAVARAQHLSVTWNTASRLLIETVFICAVLLVIALATLRSGASSDLVPLLGLYAYAGFRVIPSVNRILMHLGRIHYGSPAVDALYEEFRSFRALPDPLDAPPAKAVTFADRLVLTGVTFAYGTHAPAVQDIDLVVARGESIGIVGPTGAGKSTLVDLILGLLRPSAGAIAIDGTDIFTALRSWQEKIGYVPQSAYLLDDTVRRNVAFGQPDDEIDEEQLRSAVRLAQLDGVVAALPAGLDTVVGERGARLSGGERQRVAIARALYHQPELLVFDEATAALDGQTERDLTAAIEGLHGTKTLIIVAHRLSTVRGCDRLIFLRGGRIEAQGSFDELLERNPRFRTLARADPA
jgi:ABC-type multidrug transport system fused ATPase/permease subunit